MEPFTNLKAKALLTYLPRNWENVSEYAVTAPSGKVGALLKNKDTGFYSLFIAGVFSSVPQDWAAEVAAEANEMPNKIRELIKRSGMTRRQFADYFNIPYKTVQNWELNNRECLSYVVDLLEYKLIHEGIIKND